jgi:hypothetical protein
MMRACSSAPRDGRRVWDGREKVGWSVSLSMKHFFGGKPAQPGPRGSALPKVLQNETANGARAFRDSGQSAARMVAKRPKYPNCSQKWRQCLLPTLLPANSSPVRIAVTCRWTSKPILVMVAKFHLYIN